MIKQWPEFPYGDIYEFYNTRDTIEARCKNLKPLQEACYDSSPPMHNFVSGFEKTANLDTSYARKTIEEKRIIQELKSKFQIISLVYPKQQEIVVSLQLPVLKPRINGYFVTLKNQQW